MYRYRWNAVSRSLFFGVLCVTMGGLLIPSMPHLRAHEKPAAASVCPGFVILPTGVAVLSQEDTMTPPQPAQSLPSGHTGHPGGQHASQMQHGHTAHMSHSAMPHPQRLGLQHGQAITPQAGMLCVPLGRTDDTAWMAVSVDQSLLVTAESLRGVVTHNSRSNEAFAFLLVNRSTNTPLEPTQVRVLVRMPQHDHRVPGGHGTANDPDVQGFIVSRNAQGRYEVPSVDFSMPGPWLFEIQIPNGTSTYSAYFAVDVGEE